MLDDNVTEPSEAESRSALMRERCSYSAVPAFAAACLVAGAAAVAQPAAVDEARLVGADREPGNWMTHGRTYDEQRFSPLDQIDADNVGRLGLVRHSPVSCCCRR